MNCVNIAVFVTNERVDSPLPHLTVHKHVFLQQNCNEYDVTTEHLD